MKILIVTDAWAPQVNGVVRTLEMTMRELTGRATSWTSWRRIASATCPAPGTPRSGWR